MTRFTLRGAWEPDHERSTVNADLDIALILTSLPHLRQLTLMALPVYHHAYLPLVLDSSHRLERL